MAVHMEPTGTVMRGMRAEPIPSYDIGPILEHIGATLPYSIRGGWQKMRCPFHTDQTPSASVNFSVNKFNCFSCGVRGDGIDLLRAAEGTDFKDAHEEAARISGQSMQGVRGRGRPGRTLFGE